ncbi:hypothetical protein BDR06DRAFT_766760 [Suillus hirtellus]|nr:hypothetical protein BDR06DRAFT_766760 [Suillus hirtellus]
MLIMGMLAGFLLLEIILPKIHLSKSSGIIFDLLSPFQNSLLLSTSAAGSSGIKHFVGYAHVAVYKVWPTVVIIRPDGNLCY